MKYSDTHLSKLQEASSATELLSDAELGALVRQHTAVSTALKESNPRHALLNWRFMTLTLFVCLGIGYFVNQMHSASPQDGNSQALVHSASGSNALNTQAQVTKTPPSEVQSVQLNVDYAPVFKEVDNAATSPHDQVHKAELSAQLNTPNNAVENAKNSTSKIIPPHTVGAIEVLSLDSAELSQLGVQVSGDSLVVTSEELYDKTVDNRGRPLGSQERIDLQSTLAIAARNGYDTTQQTVLIRRRQVISANGTRSKTMLPYTGWATSDVTEDAPIGITDALFQYQLGSAPAQAWHSYEFGYHVFDCSPLLSRCVRSTTDLQKHLSEADILELKMSGIWQNYFLTSTAIPVQLTLTNEVEAHRYAERSHIPFDSLSLRHATIGLWYCLTPAFIERLPQRYRDPLQKEYGLFQKVIAGEMSSDEACSDLHGQSRYVEMCQMSAGRVQHLDVYPNPAHDYMTLRFQLSEACAAAVYLYDASSGLMLRELHPATTYKVGVNEERIDFGTSIRTGVYLVVLVSDKGERTSQRVIVM